MLTLPILAREHVNLASLDPYHEGDSSIHELDARIKLCFALTFIVAVNLTPIQAWPALLVYLLVLIGIELLARVGIVTFFARSMIALPFALITALGMPWVREGTQLVTVRVAFWRVIITDVGLLRLATVIVRSWLSALAAVTLVLTTHFVNIMKAVQSLGIPSVLTSTTLLAYRYIHLLVDEALRMMRARKARSAQREQGAKRGSLLWRAQVTGSMIGTLFLRTYERSERVYKAMLARGFVGEIRALEVSRPSTRELALSILTIAALAAVVTAANVYW